MNYEKMLNNSDDKSAPADFIVKNEKFNSKGVSQYKPFYTEKSPVHTPKKASEKDSEEKWRLGAYSSSKSNLTNSDDKKMSDWSKKLLEDSLKDKMLVTLESPKLEKAQSPRTPRGNASSKMWKQGDSHEKENEIVPEMRSRSMNK